jgi:hypothetical protein
MAKHDDYKAPDDRPDWPKRTWDLDIDNVEELRQFITSIGMTVEEFKTLPVYVWNVVKPGMEWLKEL